MTTVAAVGTDIVDLLDPRTAGKHDDRRFVARVLNEEERGVLAGAEDRAAMLWAFWAAKESAYKVASKLLCAPPVFVHAAFSVAWSGVRAPCWSGSVAWRDFAFPVEVLLARRTIRAVAVAGSDLGSVLSGAESLSDSPASWPERLAQVMPAFTDREADSVHSLPSAAVRLRARQALANLLQVEEGDLEIVCDPGVTGRRPPRVFLRGSPAGADVSLSHHGSWIAWAVLPQKAVGR